MAKKYFNAQMQIVSVQSNDIVTASIGVGNKTVNDPAVIQTPERRRSIWE